MGHGRIVLAAMFLAGALHGAEAAEKHRVCLDPDQRRAAIAGRQAVPLTRAMRVIRSHFKGDVVRARLCRRGNGLVYVLTVLAHDGKVTHQSLDGASGTMLPED
jgi:uncharacterized membrane protein YkoI